jgi:hypothetical protein
VAKIVKTIRRKRESPIEVPETRLAFHPHAQRKAFRRLRLHSLRSASLNGMVRSTLPLE